ncbi:LytR/AlgR family response regulator transcription factor [Marinisporobacter balticus]|uniref:Stage 0 sporulation protein A homolog n=1 Tax=Marinisporobacter balticus TaxID=2018667 RepID=A0A4R2KUF0_9FIRM|nr:LytTR family DNA-binding domain-containing protein [Marinisporobacter balticus]TCO76437.1 LytTR family two component transcriptional regulator [Marinisporobacter balticus]
MLKVFIVDDEKYIRDELKYFLGKRDHIQIVGETGDGQEVMELVEALEPNLVFLDIQLQNMNGLLLARKILDLKNPPYVILATAYNEYAIQGFEINVADYMVKPFSEDRLKLAIDRIDKQKNNGHKETIETQEMDFHKLCVSQNNRFILIDIGEILYIESTNQGISVYARDEVYGCNYSLKELEERFKKKRFIRTHKSYIVNIDFIDEIIPWFNYTFKVKIKGKPDIEIPVSRNYLKKFKRIVGM